MRGFIPDSRLDALVSIKSTVIGYVTAHPQRISRESNRQLLNRQSHGCGQLGACGLACLVFAGFHLRQRSLRDACAW